MHSFHMAMEQTVSRRPSDQKASAHVSLVELQDMCRSASRQACACHVVCCLLLVP
jgi:hypothetical protein